MKNFKVVFSMAFLMAFLMSCSSTKQFVSFTHDKATENGKGRIYVIKPSFKGSAVSTSVFCDNILIGKATSGSYLCWDMEEGMHTIGNTQFAHAGATLGAGAGEDIININVKSGRDYYIKLSPHVGGIGFKILDESEGQRIISGRKKPTMNYVD